METDVKKQQICWYFSRYTFDLFDMETDAKKAADISLHFLAESKGVWESISLSVLLLPLKVAIQKKLT